MEEVSTQKFNNHKLAIALFDTGSKDIVIFCHGYRGSSIGPNRFFVRAARKLAERGVSTLRFDQYGSGNSDGDFLDSSFNDWVATTKVISQDYSNRGYRVALFGQSMGGTTVMVAGSELKDLSAVVMWVPDASVTPFNPPDSGDIEENGQRVHASYWQEAHDSRAADRFPLIVAPTYLVQCTADEYVDKLNRDALSKRAQSHQTIDIFEGYSHSAWTYEQAEEIINKSVDFLVGSFQK